MEIKRFKYHILIILLILPSILSAQYYDWGESAHSIKWKSANSQHTKFVYPDYYKENASRVMSVMDLVHDQIGYGFQYGPMKMPVVMHTQNFQANGIVILAPKRMEFIMNPSGAQSATPWFKQLAVHEYRHAVLFNNTDKRFLKGVGYVLGQQGSLLGGLLVPTWFLEGDAVLTETQMTNFGRGLQPSFTIEYRAMAGEGDTLYKPDKYFCGSFVDFIPDHYQLGYQMAAFADNKYKQNIGNELTYYASKYPYTVFTSTIALKKYYKTSETKLFNQTKDDLFAYWAAMPKEQNTSTFIKTPITSYTTYESPTKINDSIVIALKRDLDKYKRIVNINLNTGEESVVKYVGNTNSQPIYSDGKLYWSEYRNSTLWQQRVGSVICNYDFKTKKIKVNKECYNAIYPAPMGQDVAYVEYKYDGRYDIVAKNRTWEFPLDIAIYGLAYDNVTNSLYFLALDQQGMWIGKCNDDLTYTSVTRATASTLSRLKAKDGKLYFNSIQSGKDEVHMYDLESEQQWQVTTSKYGSFDGTPSNDGKELTLTTYATVRSGYLPAIQEFNIDSMKRVEYAFLPSNRVNPYRRKWDVMNVDTVYIDTVQSDKMEEKPYRKGLHLFKVHSWAPMSFSPYELINSKFNIRAGVTLLSQNLLSSMTSFLSYGWTDKGSMVTGGFNYLGLAPKFEVRATYGGGDQYVNMATPSVIKLKNHFDISGRMYLPLRLSSGYNLRYLTPSIELYHDNTLMANEQLTDYSKSGLQSLTASIMYIDNVRMAFRDFLPKFGYAVSASYTINPFRTDFGSIWSLYARGYLPGVAKHHSLMLRGVVQSQKDGHYNFRRNQLSPRGANLDFATNEYVSFAADYQLPLCYPDAGIPSIIYFRRIRLNLSGDFARYKDMVGSFHNVYSYGGELSFDFNPIRIPASLNTAISISIYKPSNKNGVVIGGGISLPI